jgi:hypothetical protein
VRHVAAWQLWRQGSQPAKSGTGAGVERRALAGRAPPPAGVHSPTNPRTADGQRQQRRQHLARLSGTWPLDRLLPRLTAVYLCAVKRERDRGRSARQAPHGGECCWRSGDCLTELATGRAPSAAASTAVTKRAADPAVLDTVQRVTRSQRELTRGPADPRPPAPALALHPAEWRRLGRYSTTRCSLCTGSVPLTALACHRDSQDESLYTELGPECRAQTGRCNCALAWTCGMLRARPSVPPHPSVDHFALLSCSCWLPAGAGRGC